MAVKHPDLVLTDELTAPEVPDWDSLNHVTLVVTPEEQLRGSSRPAAGPDKRRILCLGASTTLGWGVREEETVENRPERMLAAASQPLKC